MRRMNEWFTKNNTLKAIAMIGAVGFWFIIVSIQNVPYAVPFTISVKAFNVPSELTIVGKMPDARITVIADKGAQTQLKPEDFEAYVDAKDAKFGRFEGAIAVSSKNPKITVVKIEPESVQLTMDTRNEKTVPVVVETSGHLKDGYVIDRTSVVPDRITISGATAVMAEIKGVRVTAAVNDREAGVFTDLVAPTLDQDGRSLVDEVIQMKPERVQTTVSITTTQQEKSVPIKPKFTGQLKSGWIEKIQINPTIASLQGEKKILDTVMYIDTELIDLGKLTVGRSTVSAMLAVPKGVKSTRDRVDMTITVSELHP